MYELQQFSVEPNVLQEQLNLLEKLGKQVLKQKEIIVCSQNLYARDKNKKRVSIINILCKNNKIDYTELKIMDILNKYTYNKVETPLDSILPKGLSFGVRDEDIRSFPIPIALPEISIRQLWDSFKTIFQNDIPILQSIEDTSSSPSPKLGEFLLDPDDPVCNVLLTKSEVILDSQSLRLLVSRYFQVIKSILNLPPMLIFSEITLCWLTSLEQTILEVIGVFPENYKSFNKRVGPFWTLYIKELQSTIVLF